jgi:uncharacterized protein
MTALALAPIAVQAQKSLEWVGTWTGTLSSSYGDLELIITVQARKTGWLSRISVPSQNLQEMAITSTQISKKNFTLTNSVPIFTFEAKRTDSNTIKGYWLQNEIKTPLKLTRVWGEWPKPKKQTPLPPYTWVKEEIKLPVAGGRIMLAGELNKPDTAGQFPVVVLLSGSGAQDRDCKIGQHKPFLILTQYFISKGYAVLRFDDRGAGKTKGHMPTMMASTSEDLANDVVLMVDWLKNRTDIDTQSIGLLGHSEGGMIAPMVSAKRQDIAFLILLAAPAAGGLEANAYQNKIVLEKQKFKSKDIESFMQFHRLCLTKICGMNDTMGWKDTVALVLKNWENGATKKAKKIVYQGGKKDNEVVFKTYKTFFMPWMKFYINYQPEIDLKKVNSRVLALNGAQDQQVTCESNLSIIKTAIPSAEVHCLPQLNHLFQECKTCDVSEMLQLEESLNNALFKRMDAWLSLSKAARE